jgi:hypothetical protein
LFTLTTTMYNGECHKTSEKLPNFLGRSEWVISPIAARHLLNQLRIGIG